MQYPTIAQPQYGFAPTMPGMAGGGLAALANQYRKGGGVRYYEEGGDTGDSATGGADSSEQGGAGAAFGDASGPGPSGGDVGGGGTDPGAAAQAAAQGVDNAVDAMADMQAAAEATLGAQVAAEADEAEAENAANTAAALGAQANAIAAEMAAQAEEDAKAEAMAAAMNSPQAPAQAAPAFGISFQNPFSMDPAKGFGMFSPFATVTTPMGPVNVSPMDVAAPAMGKGVSAVNSAVNAGSMMGLKEGGLAAAQQTQSKGRGQDTMLVHMTPGEVKGLQALAMSQGGSLTINPQTGLPEAGFLSSILPMVAGLALAPMTAGTSLAFLGATPFATAMTVGGITGLATGSLKKGLMAGLGAYGGASLGEGLLGAESIGGQQAAAQGGYDELVSKGFIDQSGNLTNAATQGYNPAMEAAAEAGRNKAAEEFAKKSAFEQLGASTSQAFDQPIGQTMSQLGGKKTAMAVAPTLLSATSDLMPKPEPLKTTPTFIRPFSLDITNPSGTPQYTPQDTREREQVRYAFKPEAIYQAAQGGLTALNGQTYDDEYGRDEYKAGGQAKARSKSLKGDPYYRFADSRRDSSMEAAIEQNFAKGGVKDALPPRFLQGAGDGMSDSIKARIGGMQEARLADGEFVVPADVVSHIGNGSSKAGAKKLYAMMDKIRKARTGRTRQAPEVNPNKYMPA